ncbi:MAG: sigma 54-interacting transcriptional regulator [Gammaproteobacteria bacterium]|nr:sigma 54-interacting transcriptional regulator [Gammaproteobacteria bacterium]
MDALAQLTPLMDAVVSRIHEGVILTDKHGKVLYNNQAACRLMGVESFSSIRDIKENTGVNLPKSILRAAIDAGDIDAAARPSIDALKFEQRVNCDGITRFVEFSTTTLTLPGGPAQTRLLVLTDITERRKLEAVFQNNLNSGLITQAPQMYEITNTIEQVAPTRASILLQGESGTGKTLLARMIHKKSNCAQGPLMEVNCAAIPDSLLESELFGHVKGAFTGAVADRAGRFQAADGGTLFLDEISEIPLHLQPKLLKALDEQCFQMVGSDKNIEVNVRIIAATNQNLREMVDAGEFRADLYYRLAVIPIDVPALRERIGDIPLLIRHICDGLISRGYPNNIQCSEEAMRHMMDYPWPGNVRELANAVEHGMILARNGEVTLPCLPADVRNYTNGHLNAEDHLEQQRTEIENALMAAHGNRVEAARALGIDRSTLWRRMNRLGFT